MRTKYLGFLLGLYVFSAQGNIPVTVNNSAKLFAGPTEQSAVISQVSGKAHLRALQQSDDKQWIFVSDGLRFGWIRKSFVTRYTEPEAVVAQKNPPKTTKERIVSKSLNPRLDFSDDDLPLDDEILEEGSGGKGDSSNRFGEMVDQAQGEVFVVRNEGALYEKPLRNADRFGNVESNDQVEFLNLSNDQKWVRVRVLETGEEGWLPRKDIARKVGRDELEALNRPSDRTVHWGLFGIFSPLPWSLGVSGTLSKTFYSLAIADTPLELGGGFGYNVGNTYPDLTVSYFDVRAYLRWEPRVAPRVAIPMDFGFLYKHAIVRTTLTKEEFKAVDSRIKLGESGLLFGVGLSYVPNDIFKFIVMPKLQVTSSLDLILDAGVTYSF